MSKNLQFFPAFAFSSILFLAFTEILSSNFSINGELVYTCGFSIVLYAIWCETYQVLNTISPQFNYSDLSSFWFKYKNLELNVLKLILLKVSLVSGILKIFTLTSIILKTLSLIKYNVFVYKTSIQVLDKVKLKIKSLPLQ